MKKFLTKVGVSLGLVILVHCITVLFFANGKIDAFYLRFTTDKQHSLVLGNSRAAQGIIPNIVDESLSNLNFQGPLFNYGFSLSTSPYGPYYLESIKKKLDTTTTDGLFILSVDPWSISRDADLKTDDPSQYAEAHLIPYNMRFVNSDPNIEYLFKNYYKGWGDMIIANTVRTTQAELHPNGWLEVTIPMNAARHKQRVTEKVQRYRAENFYVKKFSPVRLTYLNKTIEYLKSFGRVYLVRIPLDPGLAEVEAEYLPEFDTLMRTCAMRNDVPYLNYLSENELYQTTDGNHLYKESAKLFSQKLAADIKKLSEFVNR